MTENAVTESAENSGTAINDSENIEGVSEEEFDRQVLEWARALRRATAIFEMGKAIEELDDQWLNRVENTGDEGVETIKFYFEKRKALAEEMLALTAPKTEGEASATAAPQ